MKQPLKPETATSILLERLSAFAAARAADESFMSHDDDSPYLCFGDFGRYLLEIVNRPERNQEAIVVIEKSFALLNEMGASADPEVANIAATTVLESLTDTSEGIAAGRYYLSGPALEMILSVRFPGWLRMCVRISCQ